MRRLILAALLALAPFAASAQPYGPDPAPAIAQLATQPGVARAAEGLLPDSGLAPRRNKVTVGFDGGWVLSNTLGATGTYFDLLTVPDDFFAVRTIMPILAASNGATVGPITFRPSSTTTTAACSGISGNDYVNPCDPGCVQGGGCWNYNTFTEGGVNADVFGQPPRVHDYNTTQTLVLPNIVSPDPTTGGTTNMRLIFSDWNTAISLPRTDITATGPRILDRRTVVPAGTVTRCGNNPVSTTDSGQSWRGNSAWNNNYEYSVNFETGNFSMSANVSGTAAGSDTGPSCWTQFLLRTKAVQILVGGDSWMQGNTTTSGISNVWLRAAVALSTQTVPVVFAGFGWSGANSDTFVPGMIDAIAAIEPSICVLESFTAADLISQYGIDRYFARVLSMAKQCINIGAKVIIQAPWPRNTLSGASLTAWQNFETELQGMGDANVYLFDQLSVLGSYSTGQWNASYTTDGIHPNDAGVTAILPAAQLLIQKLAGLNGY